MELALAASSWAQTGTEQATLTLESTLLMQDVIWYSSIKMLIYFEAIIIIQENLLDMFKVYLPEIPRIVQ